MKPWQMTISVGNLSVNFGATSTPGKVSKSKGLHWVGKVQLKAAVLRFPWKNGILKVFSAGTGQDYFSISPFLF